MKEKGSVAPSLGQPFNRLGQLDVESVPSYASEPESAQSCHQDGGRVPDEGSFSEDRRSDRPGSTSRTMRAKIKKPWTLEFLPKRLREFWDRFGFRRR